MGLPVVRAFNVVFPVSVDHLTESTRLLLLGFIYLGPLSSTHPRYQHGSQKWRGSHTRHDLNTSEDDLI